MTTLHEKTKNKGAFTRKITKVQLAKVDDCIENINGKFKKVCFLTFFVYHARSAAWLIMHGKKATLKKM